MLNENIKTDKTNKAHKKVNFMHLIKIPLIFMFLKKLMHTAATAKNPLLSIMTTQSIQSGFSKGTALKY